MLGFRSLIHHTFFLLAYLFLLVHWLGILSTRSRPRNNARIECLSSMIVDGRLHKANVFFCVRAPCATAASTAAATLGVPASLEESSMRRGEMFPTQSPLSSSLGYNDALSARVSVVSVAKKPRVEENHGNQRFRPVFLLEPTTTTSRRFAASPSRQE
jgi:hypothetical protein